MSSRSLDLFLLTFLIQDLILGICKFKIKNVNVSNKFLHSHLVFFLFFLCFHDMSCVLKKKKKKKEHSVRVAKGETPAFENRDTWQLCFVEEL